jgi:LysR family hydrogen peroxide-inducible transcriptional activator
MNRPSVRQLECIVAVADARHFGRAAEACFITQPALSAQVRQLEELLEVRLFERDRRGVITTTAGKEIVARARRVLVDLDELVEAARSARAPLSGTLRLGVIPTVAPYLLPRVLPRVRRRHRELHLRLREDQTGELVAELEAGRLDLLLLALEADLGDARTLPLFRDEFVVVMPRSHPLARKKTLRESDLEGASVLLLDDGHCLRDQALAVCGSQRTTELADLRATSLNTLTQMLVETDALTLLPEMAVAVETRGRRDLVVRPFRAPRPYRTIGLAWRRTSARGEEFEQLAESLRI